MQTQRPHPLVTAPQLGVLLRSARKQLGLTQAEVASHLGSRQNRVSHLELQMAPRAAAAPDPAVEW